MLAAMDWVLAKPVWVAIPALFVIVLLRSHGTYWLGRATTRGAGAVTRGSTARLVVWARGWSTTPIARHALALVHRWGPLAVFGAYFTVGLQTAILLAAGMVRMPYLRFTVASVPGAVGWALMWFGIGIGAWWTAAGIAARSPWGLAGALLLAAGVVAVVVLRRRRAVPVGD